MPVINLNNSFPEAADGSRGPLPKQQHFLNCALDPAGPKYTAYVGGVGSGKTLIGCITVLSWAVLHPGEYLIARQHYPELRDTTRATFFDICPPELIKENRAADNVVYIHSAGGGTSKILFRPLEEYDKLRSLNLSGFYIDEANQVSEEAFNLLQTRLRNPSGLRKGILTTNPKGHDWVYRWFFKKDHIQRDEIKDLFCLIKAPSTENIHLPEGYVETMLATWSDDRIKREIYGSFDAFEGQVYTEFSREVHVVKPFRVPTSWARYAGVDHGYRNPACWLWIAVDGDGDIYVYREFYESEWKIREICETGKDGRPSVRQMMGKEKIEGAYIDPSTLARRGKDGRSDLDWYFEYLPKGFPLLKANNQKQAGIDRVKTLLKPDAEGKPKLYIFDTCTNLLEEMVKYRYAELAPSQMGKQNEKEEPQKVDDHAMDALRYVCMAMPEPYATKEDVWKKLEYNSLEGSLYRELKELKKPSQNGDPFGDY